MVISVQVGAAKADLVLAERGLTQTVGTARLTYSSGFRGNDHPGKNRAYLHLAGTWKTEIGNLRLPAELM